MSFLTSVGKVVAFTMSIVGLVLLWQPNQLDHALLLLIWSDVLILRYQVDGK